MEYRSMIREVLGIYFTSGGFIDAHEALLRIDEIVSGRYAERLLGNIERIEPGGAVSIKPRQMRKSDFGHIVSDFSSDAEQKAYPAWDAHDENGHKLLPSLCVICGRFHETRERMINCKHGKEEE